MNYRIAGRVIVPDDTGKILLVEQVVDFWIIPGGGVEEGETPSQAAIREVCEETGLGVELVKLLWCTENYNPEFDQLSLHLIYLGRRLAGKLGSGEFRAGFFDRSELERMERWPGGEFWKRLRMNGAYNEEASRKKCQIQRDYRG